MTDNRFSNKNKLSPIRAFLFQVVFFALVIIYAPLLILTRPFISLNKRVSLTHAWAGIVAWAMRIIAGLDVHIEGKENIPKNTPCIILCNHQSTWETLILQIILPPYVWILKKELLRIPFFGWGLAALHPIAIDRSAGKKAMQQIFEQGKERLKEGLSVLIFPEGTRANPGQKLRFKSGGAALAEHAKAPVLLIAHNGGSFWPAKKNIQNKGTAIVRIAPLMDTSNLDMQQINDKAKDWIRMTTEELEQRANKRHQ